MTNFNLDPTDILNIYKGMIRNWEQFLNTNNSPKRQ